MNFLFKVARAANSGADDVINTIVPKIIDNIVAPIVQLIFALAVLVFVWGVFGYFINGEDADARKTGSYHILWGVVGMAIMVSVYGIIRFVANSVGQPAPF